MVLAGVGLIYFQAEAKASDLEKISSDSPTPKAASDAARLNPKEPAGERIGEFSKGYQKWQTYVSAAGFDKGKGEMYAFHLGYGYFFMDDFSVNIDVLGSYSAPESTTTVWRPAWISYCDNIRLKALATCGLFI